MTDKQSDRQRYREKQITIKHRGKQIDTTIERFRELTYIERQTNRCMDGWVEI